MEGQPVEQEHEGERYLKLLGLEDAADKIIQTTKGPVEARNFLDICGAQARPYLVGLESMNSDDPRYDVTRNALRAMIGRYIADEPSR
ncbi:MAG TPA: hypothetical protein VK983_03105 [Candidatus Limnocylindrales bacterium]|nr:hypothetical protein [Candidatus Limnocylindrales bacterium]